MFHLNPTVTVIFLMEVAEQMVKREETLGLIARHKQYCLGTKEILTSILFIEGRMAP